MAAMRISHPAGLLPVVVALLAACSKPPAAAAPEPAPTPNPVESQPAPWQPYVRFTRPLAGLPPECGASVSIQPRKALRIRKATDDEKAAHIEAQDALAKKTPQELLAAIPKGEPMTVGDHLYVVGLSYLGANDFETGLAFWECAAGRYLHPQAAVKLGQLYRKGAKGLGLPFELEADQNAAYFWLLNAFMVDLYEGEYYRGGEHALGALDTLQNTKVPGLDAGAVEVASGALLAYAYPAEQERFRRPPPAPAAPTAPK